MKRFNFPLEAALRVRGMQVEIAETRLLRMEVAKAACRRQMEQLHSERRTRPALLLSEESVSAETLVELDRFSEYARRESSRLATKEFEINGQIIAQQLIVRTARQRSELLISLQEKAKKEWQIEFDKDLQTLAEESYMHQIHERSQSEPDAF